MSSPIDTNQPDHIVDMHEMVTDTNQASEDELREVVRDGLANHTGEFVNPWIFRKNYSHEELTDMLDDITASERLFKNLQSFIRTEKLKLLAEVRERVIGESDYQPGNPAPGFVEHNRLVRDGLRFEQRAELTKLEAEL